MYLTESTGRRVPQIILFIIHHIEPYDVGPLIKLLMFGLAYGDLPSYSVLSSFSLQQHSLYVDLVTVLLNRQHIGSKISLFCNDFNEREQQNHF